MSEYTLLQTRAYVKKLVEAIDSAKHRVNMVALVISEDDATRPVIDALCAASERGVKVSIGLDIYFTYKELNKTSSHWSYLRKQTDRMRATRKRLQKSGASVRWLGQFGMTFFSRRTHVKWSIVDDTVFSFGGVNLYEEGLNNNDFMLCVTDQRLAERMHAEHELVISTDKVGVSYPSHPISCSGGTVLIDGGRIGDSLIYQRVCKLASDAKHIVYVSQYCPNGKLSRLLKKTKTDYYFNHWKEANDRLNASHIWLSMFFNSTGTSYTKHQYLHAKFILFYMNDGSTVAITGSHNFVATGGYLGTREIALETSDQDIVKQLEDFLQNEVKVS